MKIIVYVRCTEDWVNYTYDKLILRANRTRQLRTPGLTFEADKVLPLIKFWDNTFSLSYFEYRACLKDLASSSWSKYTICDNLQHVLDIIQDDDIVCPSDDDDWFRSDLYEKLPMYMDNVDVLAWDQIVHQICDTTPHRWFQFHTIMGSNNHCIRGVQLKKMNFQDQMTVLNEHTQFPRVCCGKYRFNIKYVMDDLMSCYVRHMGSLSAMSKNVMENYKELPINVLENPEFAWTQSLYERLIKIHNTLDQCRKIPLL